MLFHLEIIESYCFTRITLSHCHYVKRFNPNYAEPLCAADISGLKLSWLYLFCQMTCPLYKIYSKYFQIYGNTPHIAKGALFPYPPPFILAEGKRARIPSQSLSKPISKINQGPNMLKIHQFLSLICMMCQKWGGIKECKLA